MIRDLLPIRNQPALAAPPSGHGMSVGQSAPMDACLETEQRSHGAFLAMGHADRRGPHARAAGKDAR